MQQYVDLLNKILTTGERRGDRTGTGTLSVFGGQVEFDLRESFPIVTVKKTLYKSAFTEMLWFISGATNTKYLTDRNIPIWNDWADKDGNLGPIYGYQWRKWAGKLHAISESDVIAGKNQVAIFENKIGQLEHRAENGDPIFLYQEKVDQLKELIRLIKTQPEGRRHIVTAWNPGFLAEQALPPCHYTFQVYISHGKFLDLKLHLRSSDAGLGLPFNTTQYALLTHLLARATGYEAGRLIISFGDCHLYLNHIEPIREMLKNRSPIDCKPELIFKTNNTNIDLYTPEDFEIINYQSHPMIKLPVAV